MKRTSLQFLLLFTIISLTSCRDNQSSYPNLVFESDENGIAVKVWEIKRTIRDNQGFSVGDHTMNATGSLSYVLKNMFNKDDARLDISELDKTKNGYKVEVRTSDEIDIKTVINQVTADWTNALGLNVLYGIQAVEIPVIIVSDQTLLKQHLVTEENGVTSRSTVHSERYEIEGNLQVLTSVLEKNESIEPIDLSQIELVLEDKFLFKLERSKGFEGLSTQLKDNYGIFLTTEMRSVKLLKVK